MENKYHRAAQDGILETLKPISKRNVMQEMKMECHPRYGRPLRGTLRLSDSS
ncbi:Uncharacterized protein FKW44_011436 [Caligus rogercresseyi]|uniref:Uncharacterized protein n=1 Tax=Caligus rogercresseyi TaxID=217165 RepID=A0A7T8HI01_CALRO|nr:Uncharacterized protein FKW44_011436 [Caligus rogercresseyi]